MHRSKPDIRGADAGAGGSSGASGMGASSSSTDASAIAHSTGSARARSHSICLANNAPVASSSLASSTASRSSPSLCALNRHPVLQTLFSSQRSVTARAAHSADDCRSHFLFMAKPSNEPSRTEQARMALACVWMQLLKAAEDGHVTRLQVQSASWWDEAQHDVWESGLHGGQSGLAGVDAGHVPALVLLCSGSARCPMWRELQERRRGGPAVLGRDVVSVLRPGLLWQDGVCPARVHNLHQHAQRATVHAEDDRECRGFFCVALQLGLLNAAAAPPICFTGRRRHEVLWMFTTRSALAACVLISQHSLANNRCVLAFCGAGLWTSFTHLAGFL